MWKFAQTPLASEAEQSASDNASDALSRLTEKMGELKSLLATIRPEYEYTGPRTVGGVPAATPYTMLVPYASPCEVSIVSLVGTDGTNAATLILTNSNTLALGAANSPNVSATLDGNHQFLLVAVAPQTNTLLGGTQWFALPAESALYLHVHGVGTIGAYMTLQFRRRINPVGVQSPGY